jgi:hypothetical protein
MCFVKNSPVHFFNYAKQQIIFFRFVTAKKDLFELIWLSVPKLCIILALSIYTKNALHVGQLFSHLSI